MTNEQQQAFSLLRAQVLMSYAAADNARDILDSGAVTNVTTAKARIAIRNACDNLAIAAEELRKAQGVQP
jgi:anti-sigma regulatory factor (Ser/Thr protein kinase)